MDPFNDPFNAGRTATAAIIGGTSSAAAGGKFANGAVTAAFSWVVNAESNISNNNRNYYDEDEIGRRNSERNRYRGSSPTGLYARAATTEGGSPGYIDESGEWVDTKHKVTDYYVARYPNFKNAVLVRNVESPNASVVDPSGGHSSRGVYGQVDVKTPYGAEPEFRIIRLDKIDHAPLYREYLRQK
ncbi:hypothetical protein ACVBEJ_07070 [Porticoccus sp. GXU_MW_L64]